MDSTIEVTGRLSCSDGMFLFFNEELNPPIRLGKNSTIVSDPFKVSADQDEDIVRIAGWVEWPKGLTNISLENIKGDWTFINAKDNTRILLRQTKVNPLHMLKFLEQMPLDTADQAIYVQQELGKIKMFGNGMSRDERSELFEGRQIL